jgi:hypothetical protein
MSISTGQKSKIKMLQRALGIDRGVYEEMLMIGYGVSSCKELNYDQAQDLIRQLEKDAIDAGVWEKRRSATTKWKYNELEGREGYATPKQLRMLNAMWHTSQAVREKTDKAFESYVERIAGVTSIRFLKSYQVSKVKKAIEGLR